MASAKRVDLFVTSGRSKEFVVDYAHGRANDRDEKAENFDENNNKIYAHYYDVTYFRDDETIADQKESDDEPTWTYPIAGDKQMVYGTDALTMMPTLNKSEDVLMKSEFLRGYTKDVVIDAPNGTDTIMLSDNSGTYNVTLQVKDSLRAIARVEDETNDSFKIVLYDGEAYAEDKITLNCEDENITVNYNVIFE